MLQMESFSRNIILQNYVHGQRLRATVHAYSKSNRPNEKKAISNLWRVEVSPELRSKKWEVRNRKW